MTPLIIVTGATGTVGSAVVRGLLARGARVRVAGPDLPDARHLFGDAVEYARLEFGDPASYPGAFAGGDKLFLMRPPQIADVGRRILPAVQAAAWAGVRHVVFLSLQGAERNPVVPHAQVERFLQASGLAYTFLRPSFFMQNFSGTHARDLRERGEVFVPAGAGRTSLVDARDVGAVAARVLTEDGHAGRAYELTGPGALTYGEVAGVLSRVLGRPVRYARPSVLAFWRRMRAQGHAPGFILVMLAIYGAARLGLAGRVTDEVPRLLGRPATSFETFAREYAGSWQPDTGAASLRGPPTLTAGA